ncbi:MAG: glycogen/starch synthase [Planctomycetes bacterium]|nr:glycogen/starch synthase [Planctomycetota bacterium]
MHADQRIAGRSEQHYPLPEETTSGRERAVAPLIFEVSWEACCQTGGIYTVLRSKCSAAMERCDANYYLIGPYRESAARIEFEPEPHHGVVAQAVEELQSRGVVLHCGRWLITGRPRVILIDLQSVRAHVNDMKYFLWKDHHISIPPNDPETDEVVLFGYVTADLLSAVQNRLGDRAALAQFHEWQGAVALPLLKHRKVAIPTVFTTHATLVGRSLSAANEDIYGDLGRISGEAVAREHKIEHRFQIERAAAHAADVFTTVSEITAQEAEQFLGRKPEVLLPNGLHVERSIAPHEFQNLHQQCKDRIHEFVMGHFFPSYTFDLERTLYVFTAGRYEYRNKGIDVFIDALYELNCRLKADPQGVTVVAFIIARAPYRGLNVETLNRQAMFNELEETCESIKDAMGPRLFRTVSTGRLPTMDDLLDDYARVRLQRMIHACRDGRPPTIVTHDLQDDVHDPVLCHLRRRGLFNAASDPVKVVFHPDFVTPTSPVLGMEYDQFVHGCNLGVFPSYYEPWGYTPMECIIRGIPAITSDQSGFGAYLMEHFPDHDMNGLYVARRRQVDFSNVVQQVTGWLHALSRMSPRERIQQRNRVESHAEYFDWRNMARYYRVARRMALKKRYPDQDLLPPGG